MKHKQLRELVLKQVVQQGLVEVRKIKTKNNPADMFTKAVNKKVMDNFWKTLPDCWERNLVVNVVERDRAAEKVLRRRETDEGGDLYHWIFYVWSGLACIGVVWIVNFTQRLCDRRGSLQSGLDIITDTRQSTRLRAQSRTVACQSMSTWLGGAHGRFAPTKDADQGVFIEDLA